MTRKVRRRRKQRFYWAEIGFLILGLIGLRPSIVTEFFSMGRVLESRTPWNANAFYDITQQVMLPSAHPSQAFNYPTTFPTTLSYATDRPTQYQANYPAPHNAWDASVANRAYAPQQLATSSNVAWPDSQLHQHVHTGRSAPTSNSHFYSSPVTSVAPHVASPYFGPANTSSGHTGSAGFAAPTYTGPSTGRY